MSGPVLILVVLGLLIAWSWALDGIADLVSGMRDRR